MGDLDLDLDMELGAPSTEQEAQGHALGDELEPFCDGCGNVIDPRVCHCGDGPESYEHHAELGGNHAFVADGCRCGFVDMDWASVAKGLRARLREERAHHRREKEVGRG